MPFISPTSADLALPVSKALREQFARDAYAICPRVLGPEHVRSLREQALAMVQQYARRIQQASAEHVLRYRVVTGDIIRTAWPELFALYESRELREWVSVISGTPAIFNSSQLRSAININALGEPGEVYRWHFDAAGFTVLLYLSDSTAEDGGALEIRPPSTGETAAIRMLPTSGTVVLMDGTRCLHRASPVLRPHERISIPMVFTATAEHGRPDGLDDYLYS
jgi:hypothetical protein